MSTRGRAEEPLWRTLERVIPSGLQLLFASLTVLLLFFGLAPSLEELDHARAGLVRHEQRLDRAEAALRAERKAYVSLLVDPQSLEYELDKLGALPPGHPALQAMNEDGREER